MLNISRCIGMFLGLILAARVGSELTHSLVLTGTPTSVDPDARLGPRHSLPAPKYSRPALAQDPLTNRSTDSPTLSPGGPEHPVRAPLGLGPRLVIPSSSLGKLGHMELGIGAPNPPGRSINSAGRAPTLLAGQRGQGMGPWIYGALVPGHPTSWLGEELSIIWPDRFGLTYVRAGRPIFWHDLVPDLVS